jgi:oligopeptide/dipeptide ABC transporter ATP-binding protein
MSSIRASAEPALLEVDRLSVEFVTRHGPLRAIDDVSFDIRRGEILGMVGESGAGKSLIGSSLIGLMPAGARVRSGAIRFGGREIQALAGEAMREVRGRRIGTIFQDPLTSLNPLFTVGRQISETIALRLEVSHAEADRRAVDWLARVGLPDPEWRFDSYPHEFSGGMRQRVVVALALCAEPDLVIADEPTTALDVSVQAQIIELLRELARERNTALLLITHDMGVISEITDRVAVLYIGRIVEVGKTADILQRPSHPYTVGLMHSIPRLGAQAARLRQMEGAMPRLSAAPWTHCAFRPRCSLAIERCASPPPLAAAGRTEAACFRAGEAGAGSGPARPGEAEAQPTAATDASPRKPHLIVDDLACHFDVSPSLLDRMLERSGRSIVRAVDGVSFHIRRGQTFALVGESGCGKSTVARLVTGLLAPTGGQVVLDGVSVAPYAGDPAQRAALREVQMVFQDPYSSLDPRWRVGRIIAEPMQARGMNDPGGRITERVGELLQQVGLAPADAGRFPHAFSGGQRQRISIARALAGNPKLLVCDEPTSALDVSVQAQILNLMKDLQRDHHLTMLFISHDLAVVNFVADVVGVMYLGRLCEIAAPATLFERPLHPYSRMLRDAVPDLNVIGHKRRAVQGDVPSPLAPPPGCRFHTRCPLASERCRSVAPAMREYAGAWAACHALEEGRIEIPDRQSIGPLPKPMPEAGELSSRPRTAARGWRERVAQSR